MPFPDHLQKVMDYLFQRGSEQTPRGTYAILDTARDDVIYQEMVLSSIDPLCLCQGDKAIELAAVAPYLVELKKEEPFTQWVFGTGWGKSWGIFVRSSASSRELGRHFRQLLTAYDEEGRPLYFRYYDPRVFRVYLPTCNESELRAVFGPVTQYYAEGKEGNDLVEFGCTETFRLVQNGIPLRQTY